MFCIQNQIIHTFNVDRHAGPDHLLFTIKNVDQIYNKNYGQIKIPTICWKLQVSTFDLRWAMHQVIYILQIQMIRPKFEVVVDI